MGDIREFDILKNPVAGLTSHRPIKSQYFRSISHVINIFDRFCAIGRLPINNINISDEHYEEMNLIKLLPNDIRVMNNRELTSSEKQETFFKRLVPLVGVFQARPERWKIVNL